MSKAEKTKQYIIEKTAPIFNQKGYAGTSMSDITEATGLTKGSIYGNFENKDEVAVQAFKYNLKNLQEIFKREIQKQNTYKARLLVYPNIYSGNFLKLLENGGCPILNTATEADDTHPLLKRYADNAIQFWKNQIVDIINKGIQFGEFRGNNINPEVTALTIIATIEGAIMITKLSGNLSDFKKIMLSVNKIIEDLT